MAEASAARLHDPVAHSHALAGFLAGAAVGLAAAIGAAVAIGAVVGAVALEAGTAGLATPLVIGVAATVGEFGLNAVVGGKLMGLAEDAGEALGAASLGGASGAVSAGSRNVKINGQPAARATDAESCDAAKVAQGSLTVGINGLAAARVGDKCTCGAVITQGSANVRIGGPTGTFAPIQSEVPAWARWAVVVVGLLPALGGLARAVGPALAEVEAGGLSRALQTGVKALGRAMEERGGATTASGPGGVGRLSADQVTNVETIGADQANAPFLAKGFSAPYDAGQNVTTFTTASDVTLSRVSTPSNPEGAFLVHPDDISGKSPSEIQQSLALPQTPTQVSDVSIPAGTNMQYGQIAPQPSFSAAPGGSPQYQLLQQIPSSNFGSPKPL